MCTDTKIRIINVDANKMPMAVSQAPHIPSATPVGAEARAHFQSLKGELGHIVSWELSPNNWDRIRIKYTEKGNEAQAKALIGALGIKNVV